MTVCTERIFDKIVNPPNKTIARQKSMFLRIPKIFFFPYGKNQKLFFVLVITFPQSLYFGMEFTLNYSPWKMCLFILSSMKNTVIPMQTFLSKNPCFVISFCISNVVNQRGHNFYKTEGAAQKLVGETLRMT